MHFAAGREKFLSLFRAVSICAVLSPGCVFGQAMPKDFYSATPCRMWDTRISSGGPGPIVGGGSRDLVVVGFCGVPSTATAVSLNITVVPPGFLGYLTVYPTGANLPLVSTLNDPLGIVIANAAIVPVGNGGAITLYASNTTDVVIDVDGYFVDQSLPSTQNTAIGTGALNNGGSTGIQNTAVGYGSLGNNTTGSGNLAIGFLVLATNTTGDQNTALGGGTLDANTTGSNNVAIGYLSLPVANANLNTAVGYNAAAQTTSGVQNVALGASTLGHNTTGSNNVAPGTSAGFDLTTGNHNIDIDNSGIAGDSGTIRIGTAGTQSATYIAGINGVTVTGSAVLISSSGQLGVQSSSIRYKEDVRAINDAEDPLMRLRPVQFRYRQAASDGTKPLQYGLIAEDVADVFPELVVRDADGRIDSVQYHELPVLLLDKLQKQQKVIEELQREIEELRKR